jgi:hypothetical protein
MERGADEGGYDLMKQALIQLPDGMLKLFHTFGKQP